MMPPPVHGASAINQKMVQHLVNSEIPVTVLNTVPSRYARWFDGPIWKLLRILLILRVFVKVLLRIRQPPRSVYIGISGGAGLLFDCVLASAIRWLRVPVVVHHHSFAYVSANSVLFKWFCSLLSALPVTHVVLCSEMGDQLCARYPTVILPAQVHVLSNAAFFEGGTARLDSAATTRKLHVGYISNITPEKGIRDVLTLFSRCREAGMQLEMTVAGPCADESIRAELEVMSNGQEPFTYLGAVYGERKQQFFQSLDLLVFPTRYANEAEPLVIYEAAEQGVPAVANARGCIASMVARCGGWAVDDDSLFVEQALSAIYELQTDTVRVVHRHQALTGSEYLRGSSRGALEDLLRKIGGGSGTAS
jgi:glycosyltransferase involved in cell wall biosynthesis